MKKILLICMAVIIALTSVMASCNKTDDGGSAATPTPERTEYTIAAWWSQDAADKQLISDAWYDFMAEYAKKEGSKYYDHKDELTMFTIPGHQDSVAELEIQIMGGIAPDMIRLDHVYVTKLGIEEKLVDLNAEFNATEEIGSLFTESAWAASSYLKTGAVYGIPFDANTIVFGGKKQQLDAAGVSLPTTYDELITAATKLKQQSPDVYPYTLPCGTDVRYNWPVFVFMFYVWRLGGDVLSGDYTKAIFNQEDTGVRALEMMLEMKDQGLISPTAYEEGATALYDVGTWRLNVLGEDMVFDLLPSLKEGVERWSGLGLYDLSIVKGTKSTKLTYDFIKHFATGKNSYNDEFYQYTYSYNHALIPSLKAAAEDTTKIEDEVKRDFWETAYEQMELTKFRPAVPQWKDIEEILSAAVTEAMTEEKEPVEALNAAANAVDALLK